MPSCSLFINTHPIYSNNQNKSHSFSSSLDIYSSVIDVLFYVIFVALRRHMSMLISLSIVMVKIPLLFIGLALLRDDLDRSIPGVLWGWRGVCCGGSQSFNCTCLYPRWRVRHRAHLQTQLCVFIRGLVSVCIHVCVNMLLVCVCVYLSFIILVSVCECLYFVSVCVRQSEWAVLELVCGGRSRSFASLLFLSH